MKEIFFTAEVQIEDTQPLPDDEALGLLTSIMLGKTIRTAPTNPEGDIEGIVTHAEVIDGKIVVTARVDDPEMQERLKGKE